jgi:hypothetical protein
MGTQPPQRERPADPAVVAVTGVTIPQDSPSPFTAGVFAGPAASPTSLYKLADNTIWSWDPVAALYVRVDPATFWTTSPVAGGPTETVTPFTDSITRIGAVGVGIPAAAGNPAGTLDISGPVVHRLNPVGNIPASGPLTGTLTHAGFLVTQTTAGVSVTIPPLTGSAAAVAGRQFTVSNNDTSIQAITVNAVTISAGRHVTFVWDLTAWTVPVAPAAAAAKSVLFAQRSSQFGPNNSFDVVWNVVNVNVGTKITLDTATGIWTVQPGVYRFTVNLGGWTGNATGTVRFRWIEQPSITPVGTTIYAVNPTFATSRSGTGVGDHVVNVAVPTSYSFRCLNVTGAFTVGVDAESIAATLFVTEI